MNPDRTSARALGALLLLVPLGTSCRSEAPSARPERDPRDWPVYLGDAASSQYSPLDQIHRGNVDRLELAWTYRSGDANPDGRSQIQCNPLVVDGVLYGSSPRPNLFALEAATGEERWVFDPFEGRTHDLGENVSRGAVYWEDGDDRRIFFSAGPKLWAVDAGRGVPVAGFGEGGAVDLHTGLGEEAADLFVGARTPAALYRDLLIVGTRLSEGPDAAPGHVRAFDARSGALRWTFRTIPRPGEAGHETWPEDAWQSVGAANAWSGMSVDHERGWVFAATGSAAYDFYGGNRHGANLFANSVLALDASSGERVWHFQTVHHDIWDRDLPAPPNLVTVKREGRQIDAVAQVTKSGHVFVFDRETGEPLFPIEERPFPESELEGEQAWPTQPIPLAPPPFARQRLEENDLTRRTPEAHAWALERFRRVRSGGQFVPPGFEGTIVFPGFDGGAEWGGAAWDPETRLLYVNANEMAWVVTMLEIGSTPMTRGHRLYASHCIYCHGAEWEGDRLGDYPGLVGLAARRTREEVAALIRAGKGRMPAYAHLSEDDVESLVRYLLGEEVAGAASDGQPPPLPYTHTGFHRFVDPDGYPAITPPWGTLNAIDLDQGRIAWQVRLGELPELTARGLPQTGTENYGGPISTAGGLLFIGATRDEKFRAFDKRSGELLWETSLPAGGYATPATYEVDGRQYVVIAAGGGKMGTRSGDSYLAFALPE